VGGWLQIRSSGQKAVSAASLLPAALAFLLALGSCARPRLKEPPPPPPAPSVPSPQPPQPADPELIPPSQPPEQPPKESRPPEAILRPPYLGPTGLFEAREYRSAEGQTLPYRLFTPNGYDPAKRYPLIVFLHGASARGNDNERQLGGPGQWGTATWTREETQLNYPAFVLAPQANRHDSRWVRQWRANPMRKPSDKEPLELVIELIDELGLQFSIDPDRLYITGLSMGGFGTWIAISRYPEKFAAAIPICGGGDPSALSQTTTRVWAFHGSADRAVPPRRSREMIEALRKAGADPRYTEYKGVAHTAWAYAYQEPELIGWLFAQRKESSQHQAVQTSGR
jgi:dienelactone hydrolase